jgi:ribonuclease P protein component
LREAHTFRKPDRLQHSRQFRQVYDRGRRHAGKQFVLLVLAAPAGPRQVGIVTSRQVGNAVARNRARRLLREAYRLHQHQLQDHLQLVMVARPAIVGRKLRDVEAELLGLAGAAGILIGP